jgi:hypothetical protein
MRRSKELGERIAKKIADTNAISIYYLELKKTSQVEA